MKSRTVLAIVVGLPVLFLGSCVYRFGAQINGLKDLYLRIGKELREWEKVMSDYTVVFAKPGIGYYACVVTHKGGRIETASYLSRGD